MVRIALCDDDQEFLAFLKKQVSFYMQKTYPSEPFRIETFSSALELALSAEQQDIADIFILDVDMPGMDGFKLAKSIHDQNSGAVIFFITSHMEHADQGYLVKALRYISKAHLDEKLEPALVSAVDAFHNDRETCIVVFFNHNLYRISHSQILYAEIEARKLTIHTRAMGELRDTRNLKDLLKDLNDPRFIQIDRGVMVNADYVRSLEDGSLTLVTGDRFAVSRRLYQKTREALMRRWRA